MTASAVATRSWSTIRICRAVSLGMMFIAPRTDRRIWPHSLPVFENGRHPQAWRARQRLLDGREHLSRRELVEAATVAVDAALTAFVLAGKARQGILHEPHVAAALNGAGCIPRSASAGERPRPEAAGIGRPVERNRFGAGRRGEMRDRCVGANIDLGGGDEPRELGPGEHAFEATHRRRASGAPHLLAIAPVLRAWTAGRNDREATLGERGGERSPPVTVPSLVAKHRDGMDDRIVAVWQQLRPQRSRRADQLGDHGYLEGSRELQHLLDAMPGRVDVHRMLERAALEPSH